MDVRGLCRWALEGPCLDSNSGRPWVLGPESEVNTDGVSLKSRRQAGSSAQDLVPALPRAMEEDPHPQSGDRKECDKQRGKQQNFRVALQLDLSESLVGLVKK